MSMLRLPALALVIVAFAAVPVPAFAYYDDDRNRVDIDVLSSHADQVSGGDALVRVELSRHDQDDLRVLLDGDDITDVFEEKHGDLVGLVTDLDLGRNRLEVLEERRGRDKTLDRVTLENHPQTGPIFSGPHQVLFVCKTIQAGLGEPLVDNQAGLGFRVHNPDGTTAGHSLNCSAQTRVDYLYRTTSGSPPAFRPLPADGSRPAAAETTLLDGRTVDYVVRRERGTINRFIYPSPCSPRSPGPRHRRPGSPDGLWNRRLISHVRRRCRHRPQPGHARRQRPLRHRPPQGLRHRPLERHPHQHPLQPRARRRDGPHDQGGVRRALRPAPLHRRRGRLRRRHPAVRLRPTTACSTPASRSTRTPTWPPRPSTSATASSSSTTWT